ncbi:MAG: hypothetical protein L0K86_00100 [Actinomycetia bacterium]|nr:hypothetical protein [Actinomycetes bacterium]
MQAPDILAVLRSGGLPDRPSAGSHEALARLESVVRLVALLGAAATRAVQDPACLPRATGLGAWITLLKQVSARLGCATDRASVVAAAVDGLLADYARGVPAAPPNLRPTKALRDHLQHGGTLTAADEHSVHRAINCMTEKIILSLNAALTGATARTDGHRDGRVTVTVDGLDLLLWPYFLVDSRSGTVHGYAQYIGKNPSYVSFGDGGDRLSVSDDTVLAALHEVVRSRQRDGAFDAFVHDVVRDLVGFAEADDDRSVEDRDDGFEVVWNRATSEGSDLRCDRFRLGPDDAREWWAPTEKWQRYSAFLHDIAHWQTIATRFRQGLDRIHVALNDEERDSLGWEPIEVDIRPATLRIYDLGGEEQHEETGGFDTLFESVDRDLQSNRGETQVVFINGEAGIGKTRAMVDAALRRAREVEDGADLPLFLYVRSTGHVLDNLSTVVAAAVASTRNLTDDAVRALCRNGLMTVLIDGFDELLGAGYRDAITSLRNWVNDLGGRGVVVVSARSSYYLGQYRSNLNRLSGEDALAVRHRIAEVQRWTDAEVHEYLADLHVPIERVYALSAPDRKLLGLPFFARAFTEMCRSGEPVQPGSSLADRLIDTYLDRESAKLDTASSGNPLLDHEELRRLFELLAEDMAEKEEREAGIGDLELNAGIAINDLDLTSRPGLKDRLTVLCGLSTVPGESVSAQRFRFQHELFFDEFLARAAARLLRDGQGATFIRKIGVTEWRAATVHGVVRQAGPEAVATVLTAHTPEVLEATQRTRSAATNRGSLWAAILQTGGPAIHEIVGAVFANDLDLSNATDVKLVLRGCRVSSLRLPAAHGWRITLDDTAVEELQTDFAGPDLSGLRGVRHRDVLRLITRQSYLVRPKEILDALVLAGATVVDRPPADAPAQSETAEAARWFLQRMEAHGEYRLVVRDADLQPDERDLKWSQTYGPAAWSSFLRALRDAGLADSDPMASQGATKIRIRLRMSITMLLGTEEAPEDQRSKINAFWEQLRSI